MGQVSSPALRSVWDFLAVAEPPHAADAIFVFGSRDLRVPTRAARLFCDGHASRVLVSGSFGLLTRDVFPKPEAEVFADCLVDRGVPRSAIVVEPRATNTLENVRFGMTALQAGGVAPRTLLLVAKEFVMRRCVATFGQAFPDVRVTPCPPLGGVASAVDRTPRAFSARLVAELDRLDRYGSRGDIRPQAIPATVRAAARDLRGSDLA